MKNITFHDSFSPTDATDSVIYDKGMFLTLFFFFGENPIS